MSFLENLAISFVLAAIRGLIKNPAHAAAVKAQFLGVADQIYEAYGIAPPDHGEQTVKEE